MTDRTAVAYMNNDGSVTFVGTDGQETTLSAGGGGAALSYVEAGFAPLTDIGTFDFMFQQSVGVLTGGDNPGGVLKGIITSPPILVIAGGVFVNFRTEITAVPASAFGFIINAQVIVTNMDGTEVICLVGSVTTDPGADTAVIDWLNATPSAVAGSDLTFDGPSSLAVSSGNGGVFVASMTYATTWNN